MIESRTFAIFIFTLILVFRLNNNLCCSTALDQTSTFRSVSFTDAIHCFTKSPHFNGKEISTCIYDNRVDLGAPGLREISSGKIKIMNDYDFFEAEYLFFNVCKTDDLYGVFAFKAGENGDRYRFEDADFRNQLTSFFDLSISFFGFIATPSMISNYLYKSDYNQCNTYKSTNNFHNFFEGFAKKKISRHNTERINMTKWIDVFDSRNINDEIMKDALNFI